jgi:hypothetical protein
MKTYRLSPMRLRAGLPRRLSWRIRPRELDVLCGVRDGLVDRDPLHGDLAPWMLGTRPVDWSLTLLVLHGLVRLSAFGLGPPQITPRGMQVLDDWADLRALGDQR